MNKIENRSVHDVIIRAIDIIYLNNTINFQLKIMETPEHIIFQSNQKL